MRSLILAWTLVAARAANTCPGQTLCDQLTYHSCAAGEFCNFDYGSYGFCEQCSSFSDSAACSTDGLPSAGEADCEACCFRNYWAVGSGWCSSDLDEYVGDTSDASACWTTCEARYGSDLVAIDWTPDGECYCQDECQCMEDTGDDDIHSITRSDVASLPDACVSACPAEEAAFEDCVSRQWFLDDDYFADDDDDDGDGGGGYFLATGGQSCDNACASAGGCDLSAITAAAASMEACESVIDDLGISYGMSTGPGTSSDSSGCTYHPGQSGWAQLFGNPTCGTVDPDVSRQRVCACLSHTTTGGLLSASEREKCLDCQAGGRGYCVSTGDCAYEMSGACFIDPTGPLGDLCVCGSPHDHIAASEAQLRSFCSAPRWDALLHWDCGVDEWRYDANSGIGTCTADTVWATPANPASSGDDDDDFVPRTCDDGQQWLSKPGGVCQDGPAVCRAEYEAYAVCYYEDQARDGLGLACDFTCSASSDSKKRNNAELLIVIIVCSVAGVCCLLALGTAAAFGAFGGCACFAKKKKMRVAEPSEPPLAHATVIAGAPPPAKTQAHMTEGPPSPGPPPLAPIKATETLAAERP